MHFPPLIAIVDDDDSVRQALAGLLRSFGYSERGFSSAEDLLAVHDLHCACIVSDLHMRGISGLDLLDQLRADGIRTPMILITARMVAGLGERATAAGAHSVLTKPFDAMVLIDCIESALAGSPAPPRDE